MFTLRQGYDPRRNTFDLIRLLLAGLVAVSHGIVMHTGHQPYWGQSDLGDFAVDGFFVLSGFLVISSYLRLQNFVRYGWHRFLRIMPGFWVCLLVVALVVAPTAAVLQGLPIGTPFTTSPTAFHFLAVNAALLINQFGIAGLLAGNPTPYIFAGSLWTLAFEALCYVILGLLGLIGLLRYRWVGPVVAALLWGMVALESSGVSLPVGDLVLRMSLMFFLGASAYVLADRIRLHWGFLLVSCAVFIGSVALLENYRLIGAPALVYILLWLSVSLPWKVRLRVDLSYGLFMYHWPLQQIMVLTALVELPTSGFVAISVPLALLPAALSWRFVEKPALRRKDWTPRWLIRRTSRQHVSSGGESSSPDRDSFQPVAADPSGKPR